MIYGMEVYNAVLRSNEIGISIFMIPMQELLVLIVIVTSLQSVIGGPLARKLAFKIIDEKSGKMVTILTVSGITVCVMCPMMSLAAVLMFKRTGGNIFPIWLSTFMINFPMALLWQLLVAGPVTRFTFQKIIKIKNSI